MAKIFTLGIFVSTLLAISVLAAEDHQEEYFDQFLYPPSFDVEYDQQDFYPIIAEKRSFGSEPWVPNPLPIQKIGGSMNMGKRFKALWTDRHFALPSRKRLSSSYSSEYLNMKKKPAIVYGNQWLGNRFDV